MIPLATVRQAHRTKLANYISAEPSPARFRTLVLNVRSSEIAKSRDMKQAGFTPGATHSCQVVLPIGTALPQAGKELIGILDLANQWLNYDIVGVTPLQGTDCYRLDLMQRNSAPTTSAPPRP